MRTTMGAAPWTFVRSNSEALPPVGLFRITAEECAADIVREFEKGSPVIFPGRTYRWLMKVQPLMPRQLLVRQVAQAARGIRNRRAA